MEFDSAVDAVRCAIDIQRFHFFGGDPRPLRPLPARLSSSMSTTSDGDAQARVRNGITVEQVLSAMKA